MKLSNEINIVCIHYPAVSISCSINNKLNGRVVSKGIELFKIFQSQGPDNLHTLPNVQEIRSFIILQVLKTQRSEEDIF